MPVSKMHPDDMQFFHHLAQAIMIATGTMWEHDPPYRDAVAGGFMADAQQFIDQRRKDEAKDEITP